MKSATNKAIILIGSILILGSCSQSAERTPDREMVQIDSSLILELEQLVELDQVAAWIPKGKYKEYSPEQWETFKDSVFTVTEKRARAMFEAHGFLGSDLVGEKGAHNFWLLVQHCDHVPDFQAEVLVEMKKKLEAGLAKGSNYAYLYDRVEKNNGRKISYGTQVTYKENGQAMSRALKDPEHVNERRKELGMEPLEEYLNWVTTSHFEMNKANMIERGITEPVLYDKLELDDYRTSD